MRWSNPTEIVTGGRVARLDHVGDDGGRVDAARQECAERHIADQAKPHRFGERASSSSR